MEYKKQINPFAQNAYDKAQGAIDHAREVREQKIADRVKSKTASHLIAGGDCNDSASNRPARQIRRPPTCG
jgi:hypothetical protein